MLGNVGRNLAKAARLAFGGELPQLRYELWNKWKGVDLEFVSVEDLGLPRDRAHFHSSSGGPALARVFSTIDIPAGSVAIDLGSGKGGAVCTLSRIGFAEVIGVEMSATLVEIARRNAMRLRCRNVRFIQADASTFSDYDRATHVYMYNPFPCAVMTQAMAHLTASMRRAPRRVVIVYRNAECHDAIMASGLFEAEPQRHFDQHAWRVYRSRSQ